MKLILCFIPFICANTSFHASATDTSVQQGTHYTTQTGIYYDNMVQDSEGMGDRQDARSHIFEAYPDEISLYQQVLGLFLIMLHNFLNFIMGDYQELHNEI